jgi:hypothetical protein
MRIKDETIGTYVGLNDTGEVVQYFDDAEAAWNDETHVDSIVSVGYVTATPTEYDELFEIESEYACTACERHELICSHNPCADVQQDRQS